MADALPESSSPTLGQRTSYGWKHPGTRNANDVGPNGNIPINTFSLFNVQGLKPRTVPTKVPFIQDLLLNSNQLFIALTETWLRDHLDAELKIQGYTCFRSDRVRPRRHQRGRDSGGIAIYIRDDLASTAENILTYSNSVVEVLCVYIKAENIFRSSAR